MKPLYWKFLLILGAVIVGASLALPKALRKNIELEGAKSSHKSLVAENYQSETFGDTSSISFGFHKVLRSDFLVVQLCAEEGQCPLGTMANPHKDGSGYLLLKSKAVLDNSDIKSAYADFQHQTNIPVVNFALADLGAQKFCAFTTKNIGNPFAVVLGGEILTAPNIHGAICGGTGFIDGNFTMIEAESLAKALNSGMRPISSRVVPKG